MSTVTASITAVATQPAAPTQPAEPTSNVVGVIWGLMYKKSFKDGIKNRICPRKAEKEPKPAADMPSPDDDEGTPQPPLPTATRLMISFDPIPSQRIILPTGVTSFDISEVLNIRYRVNLTAIDSKGEATGSTGPGSKSKARSRGNSASGSGAGPAGSAPTNPGSSNGRISLRSHMGWEPITQNGQPYPSHDNRNVSSHKVGPAVTSDALDCDIANDIFVFDRNVLGTLERPSGCDKAQAIDIFRDKDNKRAQEGRRLNKKDMVLLRPKNVALNVNDIGSVLIYLDLLVRARQDPGFTRDLENRTVTFFSGPESCNHEDCLPLREAIASGNRIHGAKKILGHPWWSFGDFCLRDPATHITLRDSVHNDDEMSGPSLPANVRMDPEEERQIRTWYHALLNHFPSGTTGTGEEAVPYSQFSVLNWKGKFSHLVDQVNACVDIERATGDRDLFTTFIDPVVLECVLCGQPGFALKHYTNSPLPKNAETGLMYLHYMDCGGEHLEKCDEQGKGKGKEKEAPIDPQGAGTDAGADVGADVGAIASTSASANTSADVGAGAGDENGVDNAIGNGDWNGGGWNGGDWNGGGWNDGDWNGGDGNGGGDYQGYGFDDDADFYSC
ncbi:uncharacterized protein F4807DRAFT_467893 [Annulohypoxylon truncatum]|uniref:uncharacterized protein n=1 Tax=Annulohypoxylon truncatum TaxID=327061 RepID=UPI0020075C44|nr:uncharacterized protein F4807DRAFT_467893 [Annulohypoxylon truncatum]KAI1208918.1 hypothetical protein F4807DRAFT_467893 [Annulohypoxylon truncatum]